MRDNVENGIKKIVQKLREQIVNEIALDEIHRKEVQTQGT